MAAAATYPVRVDASLDAPLSRWLWLVKWLLVLPHYVVLALLWLAFVPLSLVALVAIVVTGRYPRAIFEFNVGVLRWTWRVQYYAIGAFGTDRYPPFTLADDPAYPARLEIAYPDKLSRGLALVKWWLLAIPHYLIVAVFTGGGFAAGWYGDRGQGLQFTGWGLIGLIAVIAAVMLLVSGEYPRPLYDFVLGMNRWVLRVAAYAGLMTDAYPPFRLDTGGHEPGGAPAVAASPQPQAPHNASAGGGEPLGPEPAGGPPSGAAAGWTGPRVIAVVIGALLVLVSLGLLGAGGVAAWATTQRVNGYVNLGTASYGTAGHAVVSDKVDIGTGSGTWDAASAFIGTVRLRATAHEPVFLGIAPAGAASRYLAGVEYRTVTGAADSHGSGSSHAGGAPATPPAQAGIWTAQASGPGTQTVTWPVRSGTWMVVAMNADGSRPVSVTVSVAATLPSLAWVATGLLIAGVVALGGGIALIAVPVRRVSRSQYGPRP